MEIETMAQLITILNGPNLNLLGQRQQEIYGDESLDSVSKSCEEIAISLGLKSEMMQTNHEGALIDMVQAARQTSAGIIINPGALTHTSVALLDALHTFEGPVLEVHISNIHKRESFRHYSYVSLRADGVIAGFGVQGYVLAVRRMGELLV
jgi:3-dehydroquinate dehydratase-2